MSGGLLGPLGDPSENKAMFWDPFLTDFFTFLSILGGPGDPHFHTFSVLILRLVFGPLPKSLSDALGSILAPFWEPFWDLF